MGRTLIIPFADFSANALGSIDTSKKSINVSVSPAGGGTVSGGGVYDKGDSVTLIATANTGYAFSQWSDGVTTATRTITVGDVGASYVAEFVKVDIVLTNPFTTGNYEFMIGGSSELPNRRAWWFLPCSEVTVKVTGVPSGYMWTINGFDSLEHAKNTTSGSYYTPAHAWKSDDGTYSISGWNRMRYLRFNILKGTASSSVVLTNELVQDFLDAVTIEVTYKV